MKKTLQKKIFCYIPIATIFLALLSGCDEESSDNANLPMALQDKGITWFSSETYGSAEWVQTTLKYDELSFTNSVSSHNKFTQDETGGFQQEAASTKNFLLTSSGWQLSDDKLIVGKINDDVSITLNDSTEPNIQKNLTGTSVDIADKEIHDHFNSSNKETGWTNKIIEGSLFSTDSAVYQVSLKNTTDRYTVWNLNCNCNNEIWSLQKAAKSLNDLSTQLAMNSGNPSELKGAFLTWNKDNKPMLFVELVVTDNSHTANFYIMESEGGQAIPSTATLNSSNTWQEKTEFEKLLYLIEVPESLAADFGFNEDSRNTVLFEHEGQVRSGKYKLTGHTESFWVYNNSAKNDILDNLKQNENSGGGNYQN